MINYEEELKKFQPSLEVEDMADAIAQEDLTDLTRCAQRHFVTDGHSQQIG